MAGGFWDCESPFRSAGDMGTPAAATLPMNPASPAHHFSQNPDSPSFKVVPLG